MALIIAGPQIGTRLTPIIIIRAEAGFVRSIDQRQPVRIDEANRKPTVRMIIFFGMHAFDQGTIHIQTSLFIIDLAHAPDILLRADTCADNPQIMLDASTPWRPRAGFCSGRGKAIYVY